MEYKIIMLTDVLNTSNLCLSPKRYLGMCHMCDVFKKALHNYKSVENAMRHNKNCSPILPEGWTETYKEYRRVLNRADALKKELWGD